MRIFLSYAKSHIYDIHAALVAVITIIAMYYIKRPIKQRNEKHVDEMLARNSGLESKRSLYLKRANFVIIPLTVVVAFGIFTIVSVISPLIHFSLETAVMSGAFALAGYAFWNQITFGKRR